MSVKCAHSQGADKPFKIPKQEWGWLLKEKYLNRKQMKFLKEAEAAGFSIEVNQFKRVSGPNPSWGAWSECDVTISKKMCNKL